MIRDNREYRNMAMVEVRKKEGSEESSFLVEGYATNYNEYVLFTDENGTEYKEKILPEMTIPYAKRKEYNYGKVKICIYTKES